MPEQIVMNSSDEAAELKTVTGWVSRLGHFYGNDERLARWDGCTHVACNVCGAAVEKSRTMCRACCTAKEIERYNALPKVEWDGETPLYSEVSDEYFFDRQALDDKLYDDGVTAESLRLVICTPNYPREIDYDHWYDDLPEEGDLPDDIAGAVAALNEVIKKSAPLSWSPGKQAAIVGA